MAWSRQDWAVLSIRAIKAAHGCAETGLTEQDQGKGSGVHTPRGRSRKERGGHVFTTGKRALEKMVQD